MFQRKVYEKLKNWKEEYSGKYACLVEGARRVGKTTIVTEFAKREYDSYILIDFSIANDQVKELFKDLSDLNQFFLYLQTIYSKQLIPGKSVIILDEVQLFPQARQAIKHLVADGRYDYIETGSLISIKKNVKDILIPSEEKKISVFPMDFEEFLWAIDEKYDNIRSIYKLNKEVGNNLNRKLLAKFRLYMAIGGMPQAIAEYINTNNLVRVDNVKKTILDLYFDDLRKIDPSGRITLMYKSIPSQLAIGKKSYIISAATKKRKTSKDSERVAQLIDSGLVLPCYNVSDINISLAATRNIDCYKLYLSDIGLFISLLFNDDSYGVDDIYNKLLINKLPANLGYLYENAVAQIITSLGKELFYHTWQNNGSSHYYEVDFLLRSNKNIVPIEVKSSNNRNHKSINEFLIKHKKISDKGFLVSGSDVSNNDKLMFKPIYMTQCIVEDM